MKEKSPKELMASLISAMMAKSIMHLADNNPGSINALMAIINPTETQVLTPEERAGIMEALKDAKIHGTNIYVFWSDICDKDLKCMSYIAKNVPSTLLGEACSKQDYTGRILLGEYLDLYHSLNKSHEEE